MKTGLRGDKKTASLLKGVVLSIFVLTMSVLPLAYVQDSSALSRPGMTKWKSVTATSTSVTLKWNKVKNAKGYTIYKKYGNTYRPLKSTLKLTYRDSRNIKSLTYYSYYVKAYRLNGSKKIYGKRSSIRRIRTQAKASGSITVSPITSVAISGSTTVISGSSATFTAAVTGGAPPFVYQWYKNETSIPGAGGAVYTTDALSGANSGDKYRCDVTGSDGKAVSSNTLTITVNTPRNIVASWNIGADSPFIVYTTNLGTGSVVATLYDDGVLEIAGSGDTTIMIDNQAAYVAPWHDQAYVNKITAVDIQPTVKTTDMRGWFAECVNLGSINRIPDSVTIMWKTFSGCSSLKAAPEIPYGVVDMMSAFSSCRSLTAAPAIPGSVTGMYGTFFLCTSLKTAPDIPASVTNLASTFGYCHNLTGSMTIYADGVTNYTDCFKNAVIYGSGLSVWGSSKASNGVLVNNIAATGGSGVTYGGLR